MKFDTEQEARDAAFEMGREIANDGRDINAIERWLESYTYWPDVVATITRGDAAAAARSGFITQEAINEVELEHEA